MYTKILAGLLCVMSASAMAGTMVPGSEISINGKVAFAAAENLNIDVKPGESLAEGHMIDDSVLATFSSSDDLSESGWAIQGNISASDYDDQAMTWSENDVKVRFRREAGMEVGRFGTSSNWMRVKKNERVRLVSNGDNNPAPGVYKFNVRVAKFIN